MKILIDRFFKGENYTIGKLYINGEYFCDTLEDRDRGLKQSNDLELIKEVKVMHETAIPTGEYKVSLNIVSPKYSNYSKYPWAREVHGKLPRLLNVPGFEGILIHVGNIHSHTSGCILVGKNSISGKVTNSTEYFHKLYEKMQDALKQGEDITIKII